MGFLLTTDIVFIDGKGVSPRRIFNCGKTSFLLEKFKELVSSGADVSRILVLCPLSVKERFTDIALAGASGCGELHIDSFSAFAKWALKKNSHQFTRSCDFTIISGKEEEVIVKEILSENLPPLKNFSACRNFRGFISEAVNFIDAHKIAPSVKLGPDEFALLGEYDKRLKERGLFDLRDVEKLCLESVSSGVFSSGFDHIFLDGWEDLNRQESRIFISLVERAPALKGLYIAGDSSRGIYDFLGGDAEGTRKALEGKFAPHSPILSATIEPEFEVWKFLSDYDNAQWILSKIKKLIASGISPEDIAVIARDTGDEIKMLEDMASSEGVPVSCPSGAPFFKHPQFLAFMSFLYFTEGIDEKVSFADMLALPVFKMSDSDIFRFLEGSHEMRKGPAEKIEKVRSSAKKAARADSLPNPAKIKKLYSFCGSEELAGDDIVLNRLFGKFFEYAEKFHSITGGMAFETFLSFLSESLATFARAPYLGDIPGTSPLLTVHEAKGAHFKFVFIPGAVWGKFPRRFSPGVYIKKTEDEQKHYDTEEKIFLSALSAGTEKVFVSFNGGDEDEMPSPYIEEFLKDIAVKSAPAQDTFSVEMEMVPAERPPDGSVHGDIFFSGRDGGKVKISVSSLESYMKCPLNFFIERMISLETKRSEKALCGTLVHSILEKFHAEFPVPARKSEMSRRMDELTDEVFSSPDAADFETRHSAGCWKAFFSFFLKKYAEGDNIFKVTEREKSVSVPIEDIEVSGRIDRVDEIEGGFEVIDYKTGTGKKFKKVALRNQIGRGEHLALPIYARAIEGCSEITLFWLADHEKPEDYPQKVTLALDDEKTLAALEEMDLKLKEALENIKKGDFSPASKCPNSRSCPHKDLCARVRGVDIYEI
ncbi:MAG: PD-(D/E)XK nuclease family protein [Candidatus Omnitrophota bacterium]|nr:ATP-dependent helicase [Candidatus Omnitrophota bacterium]MBU4122494.1 PD-(D/E)XK nuclease family protein [bacterium]